MGDGAVRPVTIRIEPREDYSLSPAEIRYTIETLMTLAGLPWRLVRPDWGEPCDLYFGGREASAAPANVVIRMMPGRKADRPARVHKARAENGNALTLFDFGAEGAATGAGIERVGERIVMHNDLIYAAFYLLAGLDEAGLERDKRDRHELAGSFLWQNGLLHTPVVNQYALWLREALAPGGDYVEPWPGGKRYAAALSHDVDYPEMIRPIEAVRYLKSRKAKTRPGALWKILSGRESFFRFDDWLALEGAFGMRSAFYFCGYLGSLKRYLLEVPDPFYDVSKPVYAEVMRRILEAGFEVGMHASYEAYRSAEGFGAEKETVERSLGGGLVGNRHHYWHLNPEAPEETAEVHEAVGLEYDSSMIFARASGFRRGICSPYHLFSRARQRGFDLFQLPPTVMDDHLYKYSVSHAYANPREHVKALIEAVRAHEGILSTDFHVRVLNETFFPGWGETYRFLLETIAGGGDCHCDTPANLIRHCRQREQALRARSSSEWGV